MTTIYRGDDTNAFGKNYITVYLNGAEGVDISKAIFRCGNIQKTYTRPVFPLKINYSSSETALFYKENECYLQIFDNKGRRRTCKGTITVTTKTTD